MPMRSPSTPSLEHVAERRGRRAIDVRVERVVAPDRPRAAARRRRRSSANGPIWSRLSSRTRSGRSATRGRRWASRRRRRTARPAGGSSRRCRSRARAARTRPRPRRPTRRSSRRARGRASCGLRVGPNAEFSVDEPIANSSRFVLPIGDAAGGDDALHDRRRVRRLPALEDLRRARRRRRPGCRGCPSARRARRRAAPGSSPRPTAASTASAAARAASRDDEVERVELGLPGVDRGEVLLDDRRGRERSPAADRGARARPRRHGASPRIRGTRNRPSSAAGACREDLVAVEARARPRRRGARSRAAAGARSAATSLECRAADDVLRRGRG